MKSSSEQDAILEAYKYFLKQCDFDIQIFIQTQKASAKSHITEVEKCILYEPNIADMAKDYIQLINDMSEVRGSISRKFYVVIKTNDNDRENKIEKIREGLESCGNIIRVCNNKEIVEIFKSCFKESNSFSSASSSTITKSPGNLTGISDLYPEVLDTTNPNFITTENKYIACLMVSGYANEMESVFLDKLLSLEIDLQLSMFYERKSTTEVVKKITYYIGNTGSEMKHTGDNQADSDLMSTSYSDAKYIRKQIQVGGDDMYYIYIYISIYADSEEKLKHDIERVQGIASGIGLSTRKSTFRQKDIFYSCMPIFKNDLEVKKYIKRNVLTSGLVCTYPFLSNELCDENGVLIGVNEFNKSIVMVDRFDSEKYKNPNMCIIGTSGSGKSYFTKLMVARNRYMNITQYVIDPEREYIKICKKLNGTIINFENGNIINVMEIRESIKFEGTGFLQNKIAKLNTFFSLIFPEMTSEEKSKLEDKIIECYAKKKITFDDESLYTEANGKSFLTEKRFRKSTDMPVLSDLFKIVSKDKSLSRIATLMKPFIGGSMKFLNGFTNVDLSNEFIVADIYGTPEEHMPGVMFVITELFWDKIRVSRAQKKIIYLDEVWRLMSNNTETANFVLKMFKTIRKYGRSCYCNYSRHKRFLRT